MKHLSIFFILVALLLLTGALLRVPVTPSVSASDPCLTVNSVTGVILPSNSGWTLTINGCGFGTFPSVNTFADGSSTTQPSSTTGSIVIADQTQGWSAGFGGDLIGVDIESWSDSQIVLDGFGGSCSAPNCPGGVAESPDASQYSIQPGDQIYVYIVGSGCTDSGWSTFSGSTPPPYTNFPTDCQPISSYVSFNGGSDPNDYGIPLTVGSASCPAAADTGVPVITSVSPISVVNMNSEQITICGSGFGNTYPTTGALGDGSVDTEGSTTTPSIVVSDDTQQWGAGYGGDIIGINLVTWTDNEIQFDGFGSALGLESPGGVNSYGGPSDYSMAVGDSISIWVIGPDCTAPGWPDSFPNTPPPADNWPTSCEGSSTGNIVQGSEQQWNNPGDVGGNIIMASSAGTLSATSALAPPGYTPPPGYVTPFGWWTYTITGLTLGQTVTVQIEFPGYPAQGDAIPPGGQFVKSCDDGTPYVESGTTQTGPDTFTITVTDGQGPSVNGGDCDSTQNGVITDPGTIAVMASSPASSVPQFPLGFALLLALAAPMLYGLRLLVSRKQGPQSL